jgi:cystathionine beta-synthase
LFKDAEIFPLVQRLAREEGILAGGSSGANLFAALELAKTLQGPARIVTVLPDSGIK